MTAEIISVSAENVGSAYSLTRELMAYHNALDIFTMTEKRFSELIKAGAVSSFIAVCGNIPVGVMNIFYKYTTFSGRKILYIEDLYLREESRGHGLGKKFLDVARKTARENDCEQIELKCASWNEKSAGFYESQGMKHDEYWKTYILNKSSF